MSTRIVYMTAMYVVQNGNTYGVYMTYMTTRSAPIRLDPVDKVLPGPLRSGTVRPDPSRQGPDMSGPGRLQL